MLRTLAFIAIVGIASAGCGDREHLRESESFTVVVLPDTQYYAAAHPEVLASQVRWVVDHRSQEHIAMVLHEGDIVDADEPSQWQRAARSLRTLDGVVPYVLGVGNHDYRRAGHFISRSTMMNRYFPAEMFEREPWFGGTFEPRHLENSFAIIDTVGGPWLFLSLEFGPRDGVLAWADRIAKRFPQVPTVVVTHAYLGADNRRYDHSTRIDQPWNPHAYLDDLAPGGVNDGEEIWQKFVVQNPNVLFVLCGHELGDGVGRLTSPRKEGSQVHQILANYQTEALGGSGYLRLMRFFPGRKRVVVETYSPFLNRFKRDSENAFALDYQVPSWRPTLSGGPPVARDDQGLMAADLAHVPTTRLP